MSDNVDVFDCSAHLFWFEIAVIWSFRFANLFSMFSEYVDNVCKILEVFSNMFFTCSSTRLIF